MVAVEKGRQVSLITDDYREQNRLLHVSNPAYGVSGQKWAEHVWMLAHKYDAQSTLDYGCGKQTLHRAITENIDVFRYRDRFCHQEHEWLDEWQDYDPAIPGLSTPPRSADLVICSDVLEHIEPACLDEVLNDLQRLTVKAVFLDVATRPALKHLGDGRNAHLIVQSIEWWMPKLLDRWQVRGIRAREGDFDFEGVPL